MFPENTEGRADEIRRSLLIGSYETDELWGQQIRSTNTNFRTHLHQINSKNYR